MMKRLWVLLSAAILCIGIASITSYSKQQPASNAVESPATAAAPMPRRPTAYGVNLFTAAYWSRERAFMNLASGGVWRMVSGGWADVDPRRIDREGTVLGLRPGERVALALTKPPGAYTGDVRIHCRYEGKGTVNGESTYAPKPGPGTLDFVWKMGTDTAHFRIDASDPADPIRHIDCREAGADPKALFDPAFIETIRPYKAVRFMDWQLVNQNAAGNWALRTLPSATIQATSQGVAMENMVALANQAQVDPWFTMPWNADATYVENFARYVHDHLDRKRTAYVEVGNEVWNMSFPAGKQALAEGLRAQLGKTNDEARMRRYAQHSVEGLKIWARVFQDDPKRLVRILSGQHAWPDLFLIALNYKDTASQIDAVSSALYFGAETLSDSPANTTDLEPLFAKLNASIAPSMAMGRRFKQMADAKGLRYIVYEGGQHAGYWGPDKTLITRFSRDPRMGEAYRTYLAAWDREFGDLLMLYHSVSPVGSSMHFGMAEYSGQPLSETPKRKAVLDAIAAVKR